MKEEIDNRQPAIGNEPRFIFALSESALGLSGAEPRLPIAVSGEWVKQTGDGKEKIKITLADLHSMISNFARKANGEVNVDYDHKSETGGEIAEPIPSAGRVTALMEPEKFTDAQGVERYILWAAWKPTVRARNLIKAEEYRYTSPCFGPGIDKATGKAQGTTLSTVALTNRPVIEQMPQVRLSDPSFQLMEAQAVHTDTNLSQGRQDAGATANSGVKTEPATAGKERGMKKLKIAHQADGENAGKHLVFDGETAVGELGADDLKDHIKAHPELIPDAAGDGDGKESQEQACEKASESARSTLLSEIGATGKTAAEVKTMIERGATVNQESTLLAETVNDKGKINTTKLDELVDSGRVKPSAMRRALAAEGRVAYAFKTGKIHPAELQRATRLCLSDDAAFKAFIEGAKPLVDLQSRGATLPVEDGEKPATHQLSEMVAKRMKDNNETHDVAELNVIRTKEGLAAWEASRQESWEVKK